MYFGNDGGLWRSTDAVDQQQPQCSPDDAAHFQNLNPAFTGSISDVENVAPDPSNAANMMASLGALGTAAPSGSSTSWQQVLNGEGDYAAIDPANPQNWYATSEFGIGINLCANGSSCNIAAFGSPVIDSADVGNDGYGQVIPAPWILDPQNSANIILGTCRVWRGPASGGIQNQLSTMLDGDSGPFCDGNAEIRSLAASGKTTDPPGTPERIYAGMAGLYDGGATVAGHIFAQTVAPNSAPAPWSDLSYNLNNFNPNGFDISSVYVDPHSSGGQTIYATVQGFGTLQLYQSTNGGSIWQNISTGLPIVPANSVVVDPNNANTVYLATDAGVYYTQNVSSCGQIGILCWSTFGTSLPNAPVTQLALGNSSTGPVLLAATYGRGIWQVGLGSAGAATATTSPTSLSFGNQPVGSTSAPEQLLVTNTSGVPLQVSSIAITAEFTESDNCSGESIAPGDTCSVQVSFAPSAVGAQNGSLTLYGNLAGGGQLTVSFSGTGIPGAAVTLTPSALCFQATLIGQTTSASCQSGPAPSQVQSIVIADTGGVAETLTSISITGDFAIAANTCGSSLAPANTPNDSCTINITFTPTASGNRTGVLTVTGSSGAQTAQLVGTGQNPATDVLTPVSLSFASQVIGTVSPTQQLTLTNNGDQALESIAVESSTTDFIAANDCGTTLGGHSSCAILVSFLPATIGVENGTLTVSDVIAEATSSSTHTQMVALAGTGIAPAGIASAAPSSLDFGYYAVDQTSPVQTITLTNNGISSITSIQAVVTGNFSIQAAPENPCGATLPSDQTCNIGVVFSPAQVNQTTGVLTITGGNLAAPLVVALSGNGAAFTMKVTGSSSEVVTGSQTPSPFQIEIDSVNGSTGPVALTCAVVPATASCTASPASVTLTGNASQFATVSFSPSQQARSAGADWGKVGIALAMLLPIGFLGRRRRRWSALAACLAFILVFPVGCGVASSAGSTSPGGGQSTTTGQYTLTVTGAMPGLSQAVTMQVTVQ